MHIRQAIIVLLLSVASTAFAVQPKAVVSGPTSAAPGDMVILRSDGSVGDLVFWVCNASGGYLEGKNGELAFTDRTVGARIGGTLIAVGQVGDQLVRDYKSHYVTIGPSPDPQPGPPGPGPGPTPPPPGPDLPDFRFKLAKIGYDGAMLVPLPARSKSPAVADAFGSVAAAVAAGVVKSPNDFYAKSKEVLDGALGSDKPTWKPFYDAVNPHFQKVPADLNSLAEAYRELQHGVKQAR